MSTQSTLFGGIHVALTDADVNLYTVHDGGDITIALTPATAGLHLYLTGSPDQLHWLCDKLRAIVTAHESATTLAGEAAREAVDATRCDHPHINADHDAYLECRSCGERFDEAHPLPERRSNRAGR